MVVDIQINFEGEITSGEKKQGQSINVQMYVNVYQAVILLYFNPGREQVHQYLKLIEIMTEWEKREATNIDCNYEVRRCGARDETLSML